MLRSRAQREMGFAGPRFRFATLIACGPEERGSQKATEYSSEGYHHGRLTLVAKQLSEPSNSA